MSTAGDQERLTIADMFIRAARKELEEYKRSGDELHYRQSCEKAWGAIAQAVMHLSRRSVLHHREYSQIASSLKASGKINIVAALVAGDRLHSGGFYHGALSEETLRNTIGLIEKVIEEIKKQQNIPTS